MNKNDNNRSYSYYDVLNAYYGVSLPSKLQSTQNSLYLGLLHVSNGIGMREKFTCTNSEAMTVSGIASVSTLDRTRQRLCEFRLFGKPLIDYQAGENKHICGTYTMVFSSLFSCYHHSEENMGITWAQSDEQNGNILRLEEIREDKNINNENLSKIISFINEKILGASSWVPNETQSTSLEKMINDHDMSKITNVIDKAVETGVQMSGLFSWLEKGLEHYDYFYNKPISLNSDEAIDALKEKLRNGAMENAFHLSQNDCETLRAIGYRIRKQMPVYKPACRENELALILHLIDEDEVVKGLQEAKANKVRPAEAMDFVTEKIIGTTMDKMEEERRNAGK